MKKYAGCTWLGVERTGFIHHEGTLKLEAGTDFFG